MLLRIYIYISIYIYRYISLAYKALDNSGTQLSQTFGEKTRVLVSGPLIFGQWGSIILRVIIQQFSCSSESCHVLITQPRGLCTIERGPDHLLGKKKPRRTKEEEEEPYFFKRDNGSDLLNLFPKTWMICTLSPILSH